jgi:hypothetical protein
VHGFVDKIKDVKGWDKSCFENWKTHVLKEVENKTNQIKDKFPKRIVKPILADKLVKKDLEKLLDTFVTVPIDKAQNNIAFICKRYYTEVILKEVCSKTYKEIKNESADKIISNHIKYLSSMRINVDDEFKQLPRLYWTPKMHKKPVGSRFIVGNPKSSLKPLTKDITSICKLFYSQINAYYNKSTFNPCIKHLWIVQSNDTLLQEINNINKRKSARTISTYDFSSLYTNIPHDSLLRVLEGIVDFSFKGGTSKYISVTKSGANWVKAINNVKRYYTNETVKEAINFILENCHFKIGTGVFKQIIGIPMGSDPAPFFANLFLFHYESIWMDKLKKVEYNKALKYGKIFRFIDDLLTINDDNEFHNSHEQIYPKELQLNKENDSETHGTFLDLEMTIIDKKIQTKLYDKRNAYNFKIVRMPYRNSNLPTKTFYASIGAEILRICRATTDYDNFSLTATSLIHRMRKQGAKDEKTKQVLDKMLSRHWNTFSKYNLESAKIIKNLLPIK